MVVRVFVAGGTGVLGRRPVPQLPAGGHQVTATTRSAAKRELGRQLRHPSGRQGFKDAPA
jgi:nucleoside-diphosphate-sugar epimerase